jgi:DNA-binding Lrp family transcriptional regulator
MNPLLQALVAGPRAMPGDSPLASKPAPIQKLRYSHEAMIDLLLSEPWISQNELADRFGMSPSWISTIICSDLFQSALAKRRELLVDPEVRASMKLQLEGVFARSMEVLRHKLDKRPDEIPDQLAVQVAKMAGQSLGYGTKETRVSVQETHIHLEELGNNLVGLLRRRKQESVDGQVISSEAQPAAQ